MMYHSEKLLIRPHQTLDQRKHLFSKVFNQVKPFALGSTSVSSYQRHIHATPFHLLRGNVYFIIYKRLKSQNQHSNSCVSTFKVLISLLYPLFSDILRITKGFLRKESNICSGLILQGLLESVSISHIMKTTHIQDIVRFKNEKESSPIFKAHFTHKIRFQLTPICADWA